MCVWEGVVLKEWPLSPLHCRHFLSLRAKTLSFRATALSSLWLVIFKVSECLMFSTPWKTHFWPLLTADTFSIMAASLLIFTASDVCLSFESFLFLRPPQPPPPCTNAFLLLFFLYSATSLMLPVFHKKDWRFTNHSYQSGHFFLPVGRLSINGITAQFFGSQLDFLCCCWVLSRTFFFFLPSKFVLRFICLLSFWDIVYLLMLENWSPDNQGFTIVRSRKHSHGAHSQL